MTTMMMMRRLGEWKNVDRNVENINKKRKKISRSNGKRRETRESDRVISQQLARMKRLFPKFCHPFFLSTFVFLRPTWQTDKKKNLKKKRFLSHSKNKKNKHGTHLGPYRGSPGLYSYMLMRAHRYILHWKKNNRRFFFCFTCRCNKTQQQQKINFSSRDFNCQKK